MYPKVYESRTVEENPEFGTRILKSFLEGKLIVSDRKIFIGLI